jgi:hypothetical protein
MNKVIIVIIIVIIIIYYYFKNKCENRVYDLVEKFSSNSNNILDLGCGKCCTTKKLKNNGKKITSLDIVDKGVCTMV